MILSAIIVMALVTYFIRLAPFVLFGKHQKTPEWVVYVGNYLPPAVMGMLIVYSIKNTDALQIDQTAPLAIAILLTGALHLWKRNNLISILMGTVVYMALIQTVFH